MAAYKRCTDCGETKPLAMFHMNKARHRADCKACQNAKLRAARKAQREAASYARELQQDGYSDRALELARRAWV